MTRLLQIVVGLAVGLAIAEAIFWVRDDGAFSHLNLYVEDEQLGVRLMPNASERISFGGNPVSKVSTNAQGFRGPADWLAPAENAIAVVGDSQVFGLGVNDDETFCSRLAVMSGRPVLNAGVPTYGPPEFLQTAREVVAAFHPKTLVLTINMVNDLFEVQRKNRDRHRVWDGWAVRIETAPEKVTWFPGRDWAMRRSHLIYAARRLAYEKRAAQVSALPSEGSWKDLEALLAAQADSDGQTERNALADTYHEDVRDSDKAAQQLTNLLVERYGEADVLNPLLVRARSNPGDIVGRRFGSESARPPDLLLDELVNGAQRFADWSARVALTGDASRRAVEAREALRQKAIEANDKAVAHAGDALSAAMKKLGDLRREPIAFARVGSPLNTLLEEFTRICHAPECEPMLVVLPIDLQVASEEFVKYGLAPRDVGVLSSLTERIMRSAALLGIRAVDALPALGQAEPRAFLNADIHMSPKGHAAVARALAAELAKPAPLAQATGALPPGRTRVPTSEEFRRTPQTSFRGARPDGCEAVVIDEWLRVQCRETPTYHPVRVTLLHGSRDSFVTWTPYALTLLAPVVAGDRVEAELVWDDRAQHLIAERDDEGLIVATFAAPWLGKFAHEEMSAQAAKLCDCAKTIHNFTHCDDVYGATSSDCADTYLENTHDIDQCVSFLECAQGFVAHLPSCPPGTTLAGGTIQCVQQCSADVSCKEGTCVSWPETGVCLGDVTRH